MTKDHIIKVLETFKPTEEQKLFAALAYNQAGDVWVVPCDNGLSQTKDDYDILLRYVCERLLSQVGVDEGFVELLNKGEVEIVKEETGVE